MKMQRQFVLRGTASILLAVLVVGCAGEPAEPEIPEIVLTAQDFAYAMPDTVAGGLVRVHFVNQGREDHHAQFIRLNGGVSHAQFDSAFAAAMEAVPTEGEVAFMRLFAIATVEGGPGLVAPDGTVDVTLELAEGEYILLCFIPSPDGVPHLVKGMRRWLTVAAPPTAAPEPPVAAVHVDMADFAFVDMPSTIDSGRVVFEVTNSGEEPHEMVVMRLEGISVEQAREMLLGPPPPEGEAPPGPPPFRAMGGLQGIMSGARGWVTLDLPPGDYVMVCFIPSPANEGRPHAALGMMRSFTVG